MPTYRKQQTAVEAIQWDGENADAVCKWLSEKETGSDPIKSHQHQNLIVFRGPSGHEQLRVGDYAALINGNLIAVDRELFEQEYEKEA